MRLHIRGGKIRICLWLVMLPEVSNLSQSKVTRLCLQTLRVVTLRQSTASWVTHSPTPWCLYNCLCKQLLWFLCIIKSSQSTLTPKSVSISDFCDTLLLSLPWHLIIVFPVLTTRSRISHLFALEHNCQVYAQFERLSRLAWTGWSSNLFCLALIGLYTSVICLYPAHSTDYLKEVAYKLYKQDRYSDITKKKNLHLTYLSSPLKLQEDLCSRIFPWQSHVGTLLKVHS